MTATIVIVVSITFDGWPKFNVYKCHVTASNRSNCDNVPGGRAEEFHSGGSRQQAGHRGCHAGHRCKLKPFLT